MDKKIINIPEYKEILERENHHSHEVVEIDGVFRWKEDKHISKLTHKIGLNDVVLLLQLLGYDKNSEIYRKLYRDLGYSLSGYYDIFYWEANNEDADKYRNDSNLKSQIDSNKKEIDRLWINVKNLKDGKHNKK